MTLTTDVTLYTRADIALEFRQNPSLGEIHDMLELALDKIPNPVAGSHGYRDPVHLAVLPPGWDHARAQLAIIALETMLDGGLPDDRYLRRSVTMSPLLTADEHERLEQVRDEGMVLIPGVFKPPELAPKLMRSDRVMGATWSVPRQWRSDARIYSLCNQIPYSDVIRAGMLESLANPKHRSRGGTISLSKPYYEALKVLVATSEFYTATQWLDAALRKEPFPYDLGNRTSAIPRSGENVVNFRKHWSHSPRDLPNRCRRHIELAAMRFTGLDNPVDAILECAAQVINKCDRERLRH